MGSYMHEIFKLLDILHHVTVDDGRWDSVLNVFYLGFRDSCFSSWPLAQLRRPASAPAKQAEGPAKGTQYSKSPGLAVVAQAGSTCRRHGDGAGGDERLSCLRLVLHLKLLCYLPPLDPIP